MSRELKPCPTPWCNSDTFDIPFSPWSKTHFVKCTGCHVQGPVGETPEIAVDKWNTRAELSSLRGEGEPVAYMRKWSFDGDEGTRDNRPRGWTLHDVTKTKLLDDDIPLYAHPTPDSDVIGRLVGALDLLEKAAREVHRKGAVSGPQWPKLSGALVRARRALASIPSTESSKS